MKKMCCVFNEKLTYLLMSPVPVISVGWASSIICSIDGATSASLPSFTVAFLLLLTKMNGTGLSEWAVLGVPSLLMALSQLP